MSLSLSKLVDGNRPVTECLIASINDTIMVRSLSKGVVDAMQKEADAIEDPIEAGAQRARMMLIESLTDEDDTRLTEDEVDAMLESNAAVVMREIIEAIQQVNGMQAVKEDSPGEDLAAPNSSSTDSPSPSVPH